MKEGKCRMRSAALKFRSVYYLCGISVLVFLPGVISVNQAAQAGPAAFIATFTKEALMSEGSDQIRAPEFPRGLEWLNTERPLSLKGLRGKIVLLDFWTFCCINCQHVLPELARLEEKYKAELVVIGVHSAKFTAEKDLENILQAIDRHRIAHPVVNDSNMQIWRRYGVRAWPTVYLLDPLGRIVSYRSGEGIYEPFDKAIGALIAEYDSKGLIDRRPLEGIGRGANRNESVLLFPGKVLADAKANRIFISDSGHNRIVIAEPGGAIIDIAGSGERGLNDGSFAAATFNMPQGLARDGNYLYVADTENHAIRRLDLDKRIVTTIGGTGVRAQSFNIRGDAKGTPLSSPWDVVIVGETLYIAMAGVHQIYRLDLKSNQLSLHAGSGREARIDGPLTSAALAQPSGLATDGERLYFADSETSSIRWAHVRPTGSVSTIVGLDLFVFGDRDGVGRGVRLQHPLGITYHDGMLYVADTYNNKIKVVEADRRSSHTLFGAGKRQQGGTEVVLFDEPGGVSYADGKIYIADTNNHQVRIAELKTGQVETLRLRR